MSYSVLYPSEALAPFVRVYFSSENTFPSTPPIAKFFPMPNHYFAYLKLGEVCKYIGNKTFHCIEPFLNGLTIKGFEYQLSAHTEMGGISFQPTGFYKLFGMDSAALTNHSLPLKDFLDDEEYFQNLKTASTPEEFAQAHEKMLLKRLDKQFTLPPIIDKCIDDIYTSSGVINIKDLLAQYKCSRRYLEKHFAYVLGVSPGKFAKLLRFLMVIHEIEVEKADIGKIFSELNFYDLSHFVKDFEYFMGEKPQSYYKNEHPLIEKMMSHENFKSDFLT